MTLSTSDPITEQGGKLIGPYRRPRNLAQGERGSIHDDVTATKLGFRGGTVAGSIHMEQFPPILMRAFGDEWWERGGLSCYFRNATIDNEAVRPIVEVATGGNNEQINVWMERDDRMQVLEGTASIGTPGEPSLLCLQRLPGDLADQPLLRIHARGFARRDVEEGRRRLSSRRPS